MAITSTQIQQLYVAYYGRPADPVGLQYWMDRAAAETTAGSSDDAVLLNFSNSFGANAEYTANFTGLTSVGIINQVYLNLFSHQPDAGGLVYWANKLESGALTLAQIVRAVSESAVLANNVDGIAYNSKVAAAEAFTAALDTTPEILGYTGAAAGTLAKAFITSINSAETLATAIAAPALAATVTSVTDAGNAVISAGQTYMLTTGVDAITGTSGNDTLTALIDTTITAGTAQPASTFTALDSINGGTGTDVMNINAITAVTALPAATVASVETVNIRAAADFVGDVSGYTGLTAANVTQAAGNLTLKAAATTAIDVSGVTGTAGVTAVKEVFIATFAGTEFGGDTTIVFDGVTSTLAAAAGGTALAADFAGDYNAVLGANWVAVANGDGTVTFTAKVAGTKTDVVSGGFVVTPVTADTVAVSVTAATPTTQGVTAVTASATTIDGGSSQTVSVAKGGATLGATTVTTGAISVTNASQGVDAIAVDGGAAVTVNTTGSTGGAVTVGQGGAASDLATGVVGVTSTHKAVAATDATLGAVTVTGGSTVTVTQATDISKAAADKTGATLTQGAVTVTAGTATTGVTTNQAKSTLEVVAVDAVAAVTETASVKFGALKSGDKIIIGVAAANDAIDAAELVFTAAKDLTAAEVAQAFASLTNPDAQAGGNVTNGAYSFNAGTSSFTTWTSGAASGDTVVFKSTAAGTSVANLVVDLINTSTTSVEAVVTPGATGSGATAAKTGVLGVANGQVVINDNATAASITTVTVDGYAASSSIGSTNTLSKLATLSLANSGSATAGTLTGDMTVDAVGVATLGLTINAIKGNVSLDGAADSALKTLNMTVTGADSSFALTAAAVETLAISGDKKATLSTGTFTALKTLTVSGTASAVFDGDEADTLTSVNTSATTGAVTATIDGTKATYTGGAGVDSLTLATGTALTKAIDLGLGDDTLNFGAITVTASTAALNGGDGTDTLVMNMTAADALDNSAQTFYTNFERLTLSDAVGNTTLNLANLGFTNYVTTTGSTGTLTLSNLASNGTVVLTTAPTTGYTVNVKDAATGLTDVLNIIAQVKGSDITFGTVTAANVETVNLTANDVLLDDDANGTVAAGEIPVEKATVTLVADKATTVNLGTSDANIALTLTSSTAVTLVDGSSTTGVLTLTATGAAAGTEVRGGSAADVLTASGESDVLKGNAGNDIFNLTDLTSAYGGAGADIFNFAVNSNLTKVSTVYEVGTGDVFNLKDNGAVGAGAVVTKFYAAGAQYNPTTTTDVAGKVNAALVQTGEGEASWFNHGSNTYIVIDANDAANVAAGAIDTYQAGQDIVIEIVGTFNLGTGAAFNVTTGTLEIL